MQPAIEIGTVLQKHYRVVQLLGQGGFGRTYLAEDEGRFRERCAIKEFVPIQGEDRFSDKATELFQREASVLYQIEHPQIPRFRATFEEEERLFLVQDYVGGPTYHEVLSNRRQQGRAFSETEVKQFLQQMLPVLAHIHAKGIIHRDVSPDNIILRERDNLPVLIDFGVVKEVVTRMQMDGVVSHATTVGKAGYAPSEQMQTGRAYPSSDLYALAVTAIVLLTGKEPQMLFDDVGGVWTWQDTVRVDPQMAAVLNKALSFRVSDRFQSVSEMAQALRSRGTRSSEQTSGLTDGKLSPSDAVSSRTPMAARPPMSQMKTMAVGRPAPESGATNYGNPTVNRPTTVRQGRELGGGSAQRSQASGQRPDQSGTQMMMPSEQDRSSMLENPLAVGSLAAGLALVAGLAGYGVVQSLDSETEPVIEPAPVTQPAEPRPEPKPVQTKPKPVEYEQPLLSLVPDQTKTVEGNVRGGDKVNYPLIVEAGQTLRVSQENDDVRLTVLGPEGKAVNRRAEQVFDWEGVIEEGGEYRIQLSPERGVKTADYRLSATLSNPAPIEPIEPIEPVEPIEPIEPIEPVEPIEPAVPVEPTVPVQPEVQSQRVSFPSGQDGTLVANNVGPGRVQRYVVNAQEGQILSVEVLDAQGGRVDFELLMPGGEMVPDASNIVAWQGQLPVGGDYTIDVRAQETADFTMEIRAISNRKPPVLGE